MFVPIKLLLLITSHVSGGGHRIGPVVVCVCVCVCVHQCISRIGVERVSFEV